MLEKTPTWTAGQRAVVGRSRIVTIDRVTPGGRAVVGDTTYEPDGRERGGQPYRSPRLEALTPEIEQEMRLATQGADVSRRLNDLIKDADRWCRGTFSGWGRKVPELEDVEKAERLCEAMKAILA